ncbi:MAG TPA: cupin domain-containing protein [Bacillota bacterium]|nr:cupin domain-containing protein [Bacillota bacterium]
MGEVNPQQLSWKAMAVKGFEGKGLIDLSGGGLKMVRLQPGATYPVHQHPEKTEFAFVLEGTLEATVADQVYIGQRGMFYSFPVGIQHGLRNPSEEETVLLVGAIKDTESLES